MKWPAAPSPAPEPDVSAAGAVLAPGRVRAQLAAERGGADAGVRRTRHPQSAAPA